MFGGLEVWKIKTAPLFCGAALLPNQLVAFHQYDKSAPRGINAKFT